MKEYRIDIFDNKKHMKWYFDTEVDAIIKAVKYKVNNPQAKVFLLEKIFDNVYDVVTCIEE